MKKYLVNFIILIPFLSWGQESINICDWPGGPIHIFEDIEYQFKGNDPYCTEDRSEWWLESSTLLAEAEYVNYTFNTPGTYSLTKREVGCHSDEPHQGGCFATVKVYKKVGNIAGNPSVCEGGTVNLTFNSTGEMSPKCWEIIGAGESGCEDEDGNAYFSFNSQGLNPKVYEIRVYDPDDYDEDIRTTYARKYITVNAPPSQPTLGCVDEKIVNCVKELTLKSSCPSGYSMIWDLPQSPKYNITSTKTFKLTKKNNTTLCTSSANFTLSPHINDLPTPSFSNVTSETNDHCEKVLILTDGYPEYNLSWNLSGSKPAITSSKAVKLTLTESSTGCKRENTKNYQPYGFPNSGKIAQYDPLICESKFRVEELNLHTAELDHCKVESMDWDIPNSSIVKAPFVWIPKSPILKDLFGYSLLTDTHRVFDKTGSNPVSANIQYSCDKEQVEERCHGTKVIAENFNINAPVVELTPKFDVSYCNVQFNYDFVAKPDYNLEDRVEYNILSQHWDFGDGATSNMKAPTYVYGRYDKSYKVKLTVKYECPPCKWATKVKTVTKTFVLPEDVISQIDRKETVEILSELLSSQASTLKSAWPLLNNNQDVVGLHPYVKGSAGVWRPYEGYAYNTNEEARLSTVNVNLMNDGTYEGHRFNSKSLIKSELPGWLKGNTITLYNGRSFEVENVNALEVYSAAVYDLAQQQPIAVGSNMNRSEIACTSFEENKDGYEGNFFIGTGVPTLIKTYPILSGRKNVVIFDVPLAELVEYESGEVVSDEFGTTVNISCIDEEEVDGKMYSFMIFTESVSSELYTGFFSAIVPPKEGEQNASSINSYEEAGHSGNHSLRVTNDVSFRQYFLELKPAKHYFLSAWVTNDPQESYYAIPEMSQGLGLTVTFRNKEGNQIGSVETLPPVGAIIEGWQQIAGEVLVPGETEYFELGFKSGSTGTAYYDDLRLFPSTGNMTSYVYDDQYRVTATLDENNFATYYSYDAAGKMHLLKKETERGVQTIQESINYVKPNDEATNE